MNEAVAFHKAISDQAAAILRDPKGAGDKPEAALRRVWEAKLPALMTEDAPAFELMQTERSVTTGRLDMLCGRVVTEYKAPGVLVQADAAQLIGYLESLAEEHREPRSAYFGILTDGVNAYFVSWQAESWKIEGPLRFDEETSRRCLALYRAHSKQALDPALLIKAIGPDSTCIKKALPAMYRALCDAPEAVVTLEREWAHLFGQAAGLEARQYEATLAWARSVGVQIAAASGEELRHLFFAIHTYSALAIKLITADILATLWSATLRMLADEMASADAPRRSALLREIDSNEFYNSRGIQNFLESDFFSWHAFLPPASFDDVLEPLAQALRVFEPATPAIDPARVVDLFKELYQNLVPDQVRHDLGEFYTPDWLADYVLKRAGYDGGAEHRLLDPSCGSGTFLIRALNIARSRRLAEGEPFDPAQFIAHNLAGFDLNPLAVTAAKANLVLALAVSGHRIEGKIELPVYLADALDRPETAGDGVTYQYTLSTGALDLALTVEQVTSPNRVNLLAEQLFPTDSKRNTVRSRPSWFLDDAEGRKLFARLVADRFASLRVGTFDFVVGNPAWVKWSNLPSSYRSRVKAVCDRYNLFSDDAWVGGIESDISTVLLFAAADRWLKPGGILAYLITQTVFKTRSADGFRRFRLPDGTPLEVKSVDDMVALRPFEDAGNRTAAVFLSRGSATEYPVPYRVWRRHGNRVRLPTSLSLAEVLTRTIVEQHEAEPADGADGPWLTAPEGRLDLLKSVMGGEGLPARKGTTPDFNNVYWFAIKGADSKERTVCAENNQSARGHQVPRETVWLEEDALYPLARGAEVNRFRFSGPGIWILLPQDRMSGMPRAEIESRFPRAWRYLSKYIDTACTGNCSAGSGCRLGLSGRASYRNPKYGKAMAVPWAVWNVGTYTFAPYKVAWKEIGDFEAAVLGSVTSPSGSARVIVPDHKLMFLPCQGEEEAHYYAGILNSRLVKEFAEASSLSTSRGTRIFEHLNIPEFRATAEQLAVARLSIAAHGGADLDDAFEADLDAAVEAVVGGARWTPKQAALDYTERLRVTDALAVELGLEAKTADETPVRALRYVAVDIETTGLSAEKFGDRIVELAAVRFRLAGGEPEAIFETRMWPCRPVSRGALRLHGIAEEELRDAPLFEDVADEFLEFLGSDILVFHNSNFDVPFIRRELARSARRSSFRALDSLTIARRVLGGKGHSLSELCRRFQLPVMANHSARRDAEATALLLERLVDIFPRKLETPIERLFAVQGGEVALASEPIQPPVGAHGRGTHLSILYSVDGQVRRFNGKVVGYAFGAERSYLSLEVGTSRLSLRLDRIVSQEIVAGSKVA